MRHWKRQLLLFTFALALIPSMSVQGASKKIRFTNVKSSMTLYKGSQK